VVVAREPLASATAATPSTRVHSLARRRRHRCACNMLPERLTTRKNPNSADPRPLSHPLDRSLAPARPPLSRRRRRLRLEHSCRRRLGSPIAEKRERESKDSVREPEEGEDARCFGRHLLEASLLDLLLELRLLLVVVLVELRAHEENQRSLSRCEKEERENERATHPRHDKVHDEAAHGEERKLGHLGRLAVDLGPDLGDAVQAVLAASAGEAASALEPVDERDEEQEARRTRSRRARACPPTRRLAATGRAC